MDGRRTEGAERLAPGAREHGFRTLADVRALAGVTPPTSYRATPRRVTFPWPHDAPTAVVKLEARRPSAVERWARALGAPRPSPAEAELAALTALAALDVAVPRPIACARADPREVGPLAGRGPVSILVMELVPHRATLRQVLAAEPDAAARLAPELAELVARMHRAGWYHRDLYLQHVAVRDGGGEGGRLVLLDLGRARRGRPPRRRWLVKDLAALAHSCPAAVGAEQRAEFLALYLSRRGLAPAAMPRWSAAIRAHARRMARHEPRHVDPTSREGRVP